MNENARIELLRPIRVAGEIVEPCPEMTVPVSVAAALVHERKARYLPDEPPAAVVEESAPASDPVAA